jgi:hypothetical protein
MPFSAQLRRARVERVERRQLDRTDAIRDERVA